MIINENIYTLYYLLKNFYINLEKFNTVIDDYGDKNITDVYISAIRVLHINVRELFNIFHWNLGVSLRILISKKVQLKSIEQAILSGVNCDAVLNISHRNCNDDIVQLLKLYISILYLKKNTLILWHKYYQDYSPVGNTIPYSVRTQIMGITVDVIYVQDIINHFSRGTKFYKRVFNDKFEIKRLEFVNDKVKKIANDYIDYTKNMKEIRLRDIACFININGDKMKSMFNVPLKSDYDAINDDYERLLLKDVRLKTQCKKITAPFEEFRRNLHMPIRRMQGHVCTKNARINRLIIK